MYWATNIHEPNKLGNKDMGKQQMTSNLQTPSSNLLLMLFFFFKTIPALISGLSIYLGYRLFIMGVSGKASLVVEAETVKGQLINAAPGLFFAVGGIVALIIIVWKGVDIKMGAMPNGQSTRVVGVEAGKVDEGKMSVSVSGDVVASTHVVGAEIDKLGK